MRTTLEIDDELLVAARELAEHRDITIGRVVSDLLRQALTRPADARWDRAKWVRVFPRRGGIAITELVSRAWQRTRPEPRADPHRCEPSRSAVG